MNGVKEQSGSAALDVFATGLREDGTTEAAIGSWLTSRYRVKGKLGEGGMGVVLRCWDTWREHDVAIKLMHPWFGESSLQHLRRELQLQEQLHHEGVVKTFDLGCVEGTGRWFFAMELIEGESLYASMQRAKEAGHLPLMGQEELCNWLEELAKVLDYAHQKGIVHRDLKPSNIMFVKGGGLKVLDFGIAVSLVGQSASSSGGVGTAYYMAPEQLENGNKISAATDVYALGVMVYQLLTGKLVSGRIRGPWQVLQQQLQQAGNTEPPTFTQAIDDVVLRALEPEATERYQSAGAFYNAFREAMNLTNTLDPSNLSGTLSQAGQGSRQMQSLVDAASMTSDSSKKETTRQEPDASHPTGAQAQTAKPRKQTAKPKTIFRAGKVDISTNKGSYLFDQICAEGDISQVWEGVATDGAHRGTKVIAKIVEELADNDLMRDEIRILQLLHAAKGQQCKHLPKILDQFVTQDGRMGSIQERLDGLSLEALHAAYPQGLPARHMAWIFRRALSVLGYAHSQGIVHGNVEPAHLWIHPADHNVHLLDWSYAIVNPKQTGQGFKCLNEEYSPPEVEARKPPLPSSDLYSLGKCMIYLLGGDIQTDQMPDQIDERLQRFLQYLTRHSALQRPQDAWQLYHHFGKVRKAIFGKICFEELHIPESSEV